MKKRVLITYMESGMGHITSIKSIADALRKEKDIELIESYLMQEDNNKTLKKFENFIINQTKKTNKDRHYGSFIFFVIKILGKQKFMRAVHRTVFRKATKAALQTMKKHNPDVIVSTYYFMTFCALEYKKKINPNCIVVTYNPDNNVHTWWDNRTGGAFFVNNAEAYEEAIKKHHFKKEEVKEVFFTARDSILSAHEDKNLYRKKYNIPENQFAVIVADGVYASAKSKEVTEELLKTQLPLTIVMLAGKNEAVYNHFKALEENTNPNIKLITMPFNADIHEVYCACDLFITKAGPNAVLDSVFMNTPVLIDYYAHPIEKVTKKLFVDKMECGVYQPNIKKVRLKVEEFIAAPEKLNLYIENCKKIDKNKNGALDVAKYIVQELNKNNG